MSCQKAATHRVLPSEYKPASPPTTIACAPIESGSKPWPIAMLWAFPLPPSTAVDSHMATPLLVASLASALDSFPVLCSSLHEDTRGAATLIFDNANPVALVEATHASPLSDCIPSTSDRYGPPQPPKSWSHPQLVDSALIPADVCTAVSSDWTGAGCSVQVTRFACGGVVLGLSAFHCLMDAQSAATFLGEWGRQCAALKSGQTPAAMANPPVFDRSFMTDGMEAALTQRPIKEHIFRILDGPAPPTAAAPPAGWVPPHVVGRVYYFPRTELEAMRRAAQGEASEISVHDALFSHMNAVIGAATGTVSEEAALVCQAMNGRKALGQPHFFGSCAFWLNYRSNHAAVQASLPATAAAVHHSHASPDRTDLLAHNGYMGSAPTTAHAQLQARITTRDYHVASWRNCGMYDVDFGSGRPALMGPASNAHARYVIFTDGPKGTEGEGGVDVWLALEDEHWKRMVEQGRLHKYATSV